VDFITAMKISASGLSAQRTRMNVINSNLANINTTRTVEGGPYRKKEVVLGAIEQKNSFGDVLAGTLDANLNRVQVMDVVSDQSAPKRVYKPGHPDADQDGYVNMPNINYMEEMANLLEATRSFEANATAMTASKSMAMKALEIGQ
jgi:flagellar basal-body rod protein FlgC